jgi:hypothetical protein
MCRRQAVRLQLAADDVDRVQPHVEHHRLPGLGQAAPVEPQLAALLQMPGDELAGLGVVAMRQRNARIRCAAGGRRDARHDLERDAGCRQLVDLLAATPEDEGIAALEPQHTLALAGEAHQQLVDVLLRQGVPAALLADVDHLGVAPHQFQHPRRDQAVVEHHIRLLHQAQGTEGQQVRITRPAADQVHLALRRQLGAACGLGQRRLQLAFGRGLVPGQYVLGDAAAEHALPEAQPLARSRQLLLDPRAETLGQQRQPAEGRGNAGLQPRAQQPRQHRRGAAAGDRHDHRRAVDDRGRDETAQRRIVHHVDRDVPRAAVLRHPPVERAVVGGGDDELLAVEQRWLIGPGPVMHGGLLDQRLHPGAQRRGQHRDARAGALQQVDLAQRHLAAADHQAVAIADLEKNRQVVHGAHEAIFTPQQRGRPAAEHSSVVMRKLSA